MIFACLLVVKAFRKNAYRQNEGMYKGAKVSKEKNRRPMWGECERTNKPKSTDNEMQAAVRWMGKWSQIKSVAARTKSDIRDKEGERCKGGAGAKLKVMSSDWCQFCGDHMNWLMMEKRRAAESVGWKWRNRVLMKGCSEDKSARIWISV